MPNWGVAGANGDHVVLLKKKKKVSFRTLLLPCATMVDFQKTVPCVTVVDFQKPFCVHINTNIPLDFQAVAVSILLYGCTTWTLNKRMEKKLDGNYTRMLRVILNKTWRQHPTKQQPYGHRPPITKTIKVRRTKHEGHCWRSRNEIIRDVLLWTPSHGQAKAKRLARTYIQQLCADTGCSPEHLPEVMDD